MPDGVVNDRFLPWSPAWGLARTAPVRHLIDKVAARSAAAEKGIVPPKPPMFDVRTPEYTVFDDVQPTAWECVRGIDRSFGHNRASDEEHFLGRAELNWSLVDIVAKGGNLLLNVGPRGEDATIAPAQLRRLDWLGELTRSVGPALFATRPWVHPQGDGVRYTARDTTVFALLGSVDGRPARGDDGNGDGGVVLAEVAATTATSVTTLDGAPLRWEPHGEGLRVVPPATTDVDLPRAVALHHVRAVPRRRHALFAPHRGAP